MINEQQLEAFLSVKSAYQPKIIPQKNNITFLSNRTGMSQIWILTNEGFPVQYVDFPEVVRNYYHDPTGEKILVEMDRGGDERNQLYLVEDEGQKVTPLVVKEGCFHDFGGWSPDGKKIAYTSNRRHPGYFDLFILDLASGETETVYQRDGNCKALSWLADGEHLIIEIPTTNIDKEIFKLNISTGGLIKIGAEGKNARYQSLSLMPGHQDGLILTDEDAETLYIAHFTMDEPHKLMKVTHDIKWDIEEVKLSPDGESFAYVLNEAGFSRLIYCNLESGEVQEVKGLLRGVVKSINWLGNDQFLFAMESPTCPGDIWQYDAVNDTIKRMTFFSENKDIESLFVEPETRIFSSFDGRGIPYLFFEQGKGVNRPAVIYVHGGPEGQTKGQYFGGIQYLLQLGFAVIAPNIRGSNGFGRTYIKLDDRRKRMDAVKDLAALNEHIVKEHKIDPERIGIFGISYGGYMTLSAITHYPKLWRAAVDLVGMSNLRTFLESTGPWRRKLRSDEYGTLEEDADFFEKIAPLNLAENVQAPLLIFHGENDSRVPITESIQMVEKLRELDKEVEYIPFPDEGHVTHKVANKVKEYSELVKFFVKHIAK